MSKVIRISDSIFKRLQQLSTPLIDTPATVIERILDFYEQRQNPTMNSSKIDDPGDFTIKTYDDVGLYLAPASEDNLQTSILGSIPISVAEAYLDTFQLAELKTALNGKDKFHCWAMTKSRRSQFNQMNPGDIVLFSSKGTGRFSYKGKVICKLQSAALGNALWSVVPGMPWELIYFLDDIEKINIDKEKLVIALGYDQSYVVPGVVRVSEERMKHAAKHYGRVEELLMKLA